MIVNYSELPSIREIHRKERIIFGGGVFDLIHEGHVEALEYWKSLGDKLVVGVVSDERVRQRKGNDRPLRDEESRLAVVNAFKMVDYCFILPLPVDNISPTVQTIKELHPDVFVSYQDSGLRFVDGSDPLMTLDVEIIIDDRPKRDSTSSIIERAIRQSISK